MKARIKQFLLKHPALTFLLPVGRFVLTAPFRFRNVYFREILRLRLFCLWFSRRQPLLLFARFGGIGDILCSLPAFAAVCRDNPKAHGVFITLTEFKCLPTLARSPGSVCASRVHCSIPKFPRWMILKVFTPQYTDELGRQNSSAHLIDEFFQACGLPPADVVTRFDANPDNIIKMRETLRIQPGGKTKTVVIHPGPTWKVKEWPVEHWQMLVDGLGTSSPVRIIQIGAHRHITRGATNAPTLLRTESLVGQLSLEDIAALLSVADLFVGIDSGMMHMAGAVGTPSVGIFGPTNPARILRYSKAVALSHTLPCSFCHHSYPRLHFQSGCPHDIACMNLLKPELVLEKCRMLLENPN